ncbi:hypothetical protein P170DRAFT_350479 [Aspergillus steynii IBT 23096]|uniref:Zn(2)-C6 fungal-type domain-containing protein n=1 Tax=Aspergillus steynii IBT 23096 TaxID=1392250 RepID=A0A2I2GH12_9EURO|nr:uncharacterized protein P170DRAFT_350479 [Aspergillus steynii IBT 23096]PLB52165.1 hypothetical protein P170DRAFT_350479 [Aspergillus steynii IBT 23096]
MSLASAGPRRYMSKAQRACDFCRSRKSACQIDTVPPCRLCRAHRQPCEFTDRIVRRRRPIAERRLSTSPISSNEMATQEQLHEDVVQPQHLDFLPVTGSPFALESSTLGDQLMGFDLEKELDDGLHGSSVPAGGDQSIMDDLMLSIYDDQGLSRFDTIPRSAQIPLDSNLSVASQLCGLTGDMDPYLLRHYQFDEKSEFAFSKLTVRAVQDTGVPVQFLLSKPNPSIDSRDQVLSHIQDGQLPALSQIVPAEIGERLIKLFIRFINPQFPILSEENLPNPSNAPCNLLAAIYSITQPFTAFDDYLCIELVYSPPSPEVLFKIAWNALNNALSEPTISSLQAALILLLQPPENPLVLDSAGKWALLGMTVSMAQTLGLHLDPCHWNIPTEEVRTRQRLSWITYTVDKWLASSFGRPSHISKNDWMIIELPSTSIGTKTTDNSEESYTYQFLKLTTILDKILTDLYSLRSISTLSKDFRLTISIARPIMQELTMWHANLPPSMMIDSTNEYRTTVSDNSASLQIAYQSLKILVLRALLRPFNNASPSPEDTEEWHAAKSQILKTASVEADAALSLVSSFRPVHYQAFWASWSKTSFALITNLLFLLAVTVHQEGVGSGEEYKKRREALDQARSIFRLHAKSLDMIRFALLRIDAVFWIGWEKVLGFP